MTDMTYKHLMNQVSNAWVDAKIFG
jgi:hypothetical protein